MGWRNVGYAEVSVAELFTPTKAEDDPRFKLASAQMQADEDEFDDMHLHVRNDVRRFNAFIELHKAQYDSSQDNKRWLLAIAGFLFVTQSDKIIAFVEHFF